jgi:hypothetical protein
MRPRLRRIAGLACLLAAGVACAELLAREYEYEEQVYLGTDGSASVVVNASIAALVAAHGFDLDTSPDAGVDRDAIGRLYASPGVRVTHISRPWRRRGRTFVQVEVETDDVRALSRAPGFSWSTYEFEQVPALEPEADPLLRFRQALGPPAGEPPAAAGWDGSELMAVRLHLPSRIAYHNAPSREVERGNIVAWEQPLGERLDGTPLDVEVRIEQQSILYSTLLVFGVAMAAALGTLALAVWWAARRGRLSAAAMPATRPRSSARS